MSIEQYETSVINTVYTFYLWFIGRIRGLHGRTWSVSLFRFRYKESNGTSSSKTYTYYRVVNPWEPTLTLLRTLRRRWKDEETQKDEHLCQYVWNTKGRSHKETHHWSKYHSFPPTLYCRLKTRDLVSMSLHKNFNCRSHNPRVKGR